MYLHSLREVRQFSDTRLWAPTLVEAILQRNALGVGQGAGHGKNEINVHKVLLDVLPFLIHIYTMV